MVNKVLMMAVGADNGNSSIFAPQTMGRLVRALALGPGSLTPYHEAISSNNHVFQYFSSRKTIFVQTSHQSFSQL
jgi:hypothetical protein